MMKNEEVKIALRKVFDAGMRNQKLHPDDDSYDDVNFEKALKKAIPVLKKELWEEACRAQMEAVFEHCKSVSSTNGHMVKHWVKNVPFPNWKDVEGIMHGKIIETP